MACTVAAPSELRQFTWLDILGRRRHEARRAGVIVAPANPVLGSAHRPALMLKPRSGQEAAVDREEILGRDRLLAAQMLDGPRHRLQVVQHLDRGHVRQFIAAASCRLGLEQPAASDLQALDARRCDRLGPEQDAGEQKPALRWSPRASRRGRLRAPVASAGPLWRLDFASPWCRPQPRGEQLPRWADLPRAPRPGSR